MPKTLLEPGASTSGHRDPWPRSVVCGVDGTGQGREAARQAAALAGPHGQLALHAVKHGPGNSLSCAAALEEALLIARTVGGKVETRAAPAATVATGLIRAAVGADVLVVGCDALGPTPKAVVRRAPCSVLLARRPPDLPVFDLIMVPERSSSRLHSVVADLARAHGSECRAVPTARLPLAAAAMGCGLIVIGDGAPALALAQAAPCSVLVVREP